MLDGRVLEASQVEYKPFGKPPLKRGADTSTSNFFCHTRLGALSHWSRAINEWKHYQLRCVVYNIQHALIVEIMANWPCFLEEVLYDLELAGRVAA